MPGRKKRASAYLVARKKLGRTAARGFAGSAFPARRLLYNQAGGSERFHGLEHKEDRRW